MENKEIVETVDTEKTQVETTDAEVTENVAEVNEVEKTFTQSELNDILKQRVARERKSWEKNTPKVEPKVDNSKVKELSLKVAEYERELALSKYDIDDDFKEYVNYKVLRNVGKDKSYADAINDFFAEENNSKFLKAKEIEPQKNKISTPRVKNVGGNDEASRLAQSIRKAAGLD